MEPRYGGLEDDFPFQLGDFWCSIWISGGKQQGLISWGLNSILLLWLGLQLVEPPTDRHTPRCINTQVTSACKEICAKLFLYVCVIQLQKVAGNVSEKWGFITLSKFDQNSWDLKHCFCWIQSTVLVTKVVPGQGASKKPPLTIPKDWWHKALLLSGLVDARCMARKFLLGLSFFAIVSRICLVLSAKWWMILRGGIHGTQVITSMGDSEV